jgi:hypothetical protein
MSALRQAPSFAKASAFVQLRRDQTAGKHDRRIGADHLFGKIIDG